MKIKYILSTLIITLSTALSAQVNLGTISGVIYDAYSTEVIPFATVWIDTESGKRPTFSDENGQYKIDALKPGTYNLHVKSLGYDSLTISEITISSGIITVDAHCGQDNTLDPIVIYIPLIIPKDIPKIEYLLEDIEHSPNTQDPIAILVGSSSDVQRIEGTSDIIIRGSRPGDAVYYIDGVKTTTMSGVPGVSIGGLVAYTGGIPAKYGDTTGGVVVLETKGYFDLYNRWKYSSN